MKITKIIITLGILALFATTSFAGEKVKLTNTQLEILMNSASPSYQAIAEVKRSVSDDADKLKLYKFMAGITNSPEMKAYLERKGEIVSAFNDMNSKLKKEEKKAATIDNMPDMLNLLNLDSGLEVEKYSISLKKAKGLSIETMERTDWLFEFVE